MCAFQKTIKKAGCFGSLPFLMPAICYFSCHIFRSIKPANRDTLRAMPRTPITDSSTTREIYSVSDLNNAARDLLEGHFPLIWVEGEISNLARPASGHIYFSLKDSDAQLRCAMFKMRNRLTNFRPENGQQILVRGRLSLYPARGDYQLIVEHMEEAGDGALRRQFELLKQQLHNEGLFDEASKQSLPELPTRLGIITSPTGAAIRDILSALTRRFPGIPVLIYPVPVQRADPPPAIFPPLNNAA